MKEFTFGICTYNSSDFILETLESVKYQVKNYGNNICTNLVLTDDSSSDNTVNIVEEWLNYNGNLFNHVTFLKHEKNKGIAHNYVELLRNIYTEYFIKIDGDDLLASGNIYEKCFDVDKNECKVYFPMRYNEKTGIYYTENDRDNMIYYSNRKHDNMHDLRLIETLKPFITPEIVITRSNFTDECLKFVEKFTQFEDDPSIWFIFRTNRNIKLSFSMEPIVLYRVHNKSLSNGGESIHQIHFLDDLCKFKKIMLKTEKNIGTKFFCLQQLGIHFL